MIIFVKKTSRNLRSNLIKLLLFLFVVTISPGLAPSENKPVVVENKNSVLVYHLKGGFLKDFHLKNTSVNPFKVSENVENSGHAIQILSGGSIQIAAKECRETFWELTNSPILKGRNIEMMMKADFLNEKVLVKRFITYPTSSSLISVKEEVYNTDENERTLALNQQISLSSQLLEGSVIYSNITVSGAGNIKIKKIDINSPESGILIIANSQKDFFIGYVFNKEDYPTVNLINSSSLLLILVGNSSYKTKFNEFSTYKYSVFMGNSGKEFKGFEEALISDEKLLIRGTAGIKHEFDIPSQF